MKTTLISTILASALFAGAAVAAPIQVEVPSDAQPPRSTVKRADVLADFHIWRLSGLQDLNRGEGYVDTNSTDYRRAEATYQRLRSSPQFPALVSELEARPTANVVALRTMRRMAQATQ